MERNGESFTINLVTNIWAAF